MVHAEEVGRPERTPSVTRTRDRQRWTDFGVGSLHIDGRLDGGDVLELLVRRSGGNKSEVLRQLGQEMMSAAGWKHYWQLRHKPVNVIIKWVSKFVSGKGLSVLEEHAQR
jgi:hypothetical protein